jgi:hypothetical protein
MLAVFEPLKRPQLGRADLDRPVGGPAELAAYREGTARADAAVAAVQRELDGLKRHVQERLLGGAAGTKPSALPADAVAAFQAEPTQRSNSQKALVKKYGDELEKEIREAASAPEKEQRERLEKQIAGINAARPKELPHAYIWYEDDPEAPVTHVLHRGDPTRPRQEVAPAVPTVLTRQQPDPPKPLARSTGRRLWLARWLTGPDNPLTARVMVNRIWQHHFGRGLVASANDFGVVGDPPTHPELLNWLAAEFMAGGWHVKALQRLIVLSSTYQAAGTFQSEAARVDPKDALLWRWRQRRLEAEAVRDSILAVSGRLNPQAGGPGIYPQLPRAVLEGQSRPGDGWGKSDEQQMARRSIYIYVKRSLAVPELEVLDAPDTTSSCEARPVSTIAPQALTFLNGEFINEQARHFAARLQREAGGEAPARVQRAFELALCRPPRPDEMQASLDFLAVQQRQIEAELRKVHKDPGSAAQRALEAFCLVMLNTSEFVYVD